LSDDLGCTPQAVSKKAKGWNKATDHSLEVAKQLDITRPVPGSALGKRSPENVAQLINAMALLRNEELACAAIGINAATLYRWKQEDPELARQVQAARARKVAGWVQAIDNATSKDWKAANKLLQVAPETKEVWTEQRNNTIEVRLNITRE
jgi:hypothetical protein